MKKIQEVLKNKSGQGVPMILAVVLCCLILACVTFEYMRLMIVAQGVRDSVQSAIVDVATENWDEAYAGLREGYSGGYQLAGSSWSQNVTSGNVYARLQDVLGIEYEGGQYVKYSGENLEYRLYDLHLDVENAPLAPSVPDGITQLNVTGTITVDVPLSFGFGHLPPMQITMKLNAKYVPSHVFFRLDRKKPAPTIVPGHNALPVHPTLNRTLTIREAARIQTFPDEFEFVGPIINQCLQVGNAFPCIVGQMLGDRLRTIVNKQWDTDRATTLAKKSMLVR